MSKTVTISKTKIAKIHKLAKTMPSLTKVAALMKKAQDEGNLGPDEVKDIAEDTQEVLLSVVEMIGDIVEGVPAEDAIVDDTDNDVDDVISDDIPNKDDDKIIGGQDDNDDEIKKRENIQIAKLTKEITQIKDAGLHKDLTIKYGKLFPDTIREAKEKQFAASKDSIPILEARIKEAAQTIKDRKSMKIAQLTDGTYIEDDDDYTTTTGSSLDYKGKF